MTRKPHIDSPSEMARIAAALGKVFVSPFPLTELGQKYFDQIIAEKAKAEWSDHDVSLAAILARMMAEISDDPESKEVTKKITACISMRRSLGLHNVATTSHPKEAQGRRDKALEIQNFMMAPNESLIAEPEHYNA